MREGELYLYAGELHRSMVLSWSEAGKSRLLSIPAERVAEVKQKSEEYLRFRRARARVGEIHREILGVMTGSKRFAEKTLEIKEATESQRVHAL